MTALPSLWPLVSGEKRNREEFGVELGLARDESQSVCVTALWGTQCLTQLQLQGGGPTEGALILWPAHPQVA